MKVCRHGSRSGTTAIGPVGGIAAGRRWGVEAVQWLSDVVEGRAELGEVTEESWCRSGA
ncbi:hypothetical protein GCM10009849_16680 [Sinomonas flava]|uniref:Uncharacterized protein n=1 Tax=Sinomonas flava TaxID=496857 RepID=A0ABP5NJ27_9MICC